MAPEERKPLKFQWQKFRIHRIVVQARLSRHRRCPYMDRRRYVDDPRISGGTLGIAAEGRAPERRPFDKIAHLDLAHRDHYADNLVNFIWDVADLLRGPYRPPEYRKVMLPMTVDKKLEELVVNRMDRNSTQAVRFLDNPEIRRS
jgi:hypothetical protein